MKLPKKKPKKKLIAVWVDPEDYERLRIKLKAFNYTFAEWLRWRIGKELD
jgi:hypothetical protein